VTLSEELGGITVSTALLHIGTHAAATPGKPAAILATTGETMTFAELDTRSRALASTLAGRGVAAGGRLAILLENSLPYFVAGWAAQRSGLYYIPVNWHLTAAEATYIIEDSGAQAVLTSPALLDSVGTVGGHLEPPGLTFVTGTAPADAESYEQAVSAAAGAGRGAAAGYAETEGSFMFYSSGTTGRPKGIKRALTGEPFGSPQLSVQMLRTVYGMDSGTVCLCPAPLYHAAPLGWSMNVQRMGGTVVLMERFDALEMLRLIERYQVTHLQVVPTMFVRLLKLPPEQRSAFDLSSLRQVAHAAAPCPVEVKERMLDWWGPIIREYYAGSESTGYCTIGSDEWRAHPGSVGRNIMGSIHITDDDGVPLPPGEIGTVWFEGPERFEYHNDPAKTAEAFNDRGWSTLGDMGSVDEDGYLYLSDRRTNLILSGGTNIYPQEVENLLALHPEVKDVAVIGVADEELGQRVLAVVTPADMARAGAELERELIDYCRERLAHYKCPRQVVFDEDIPRLPTGKLAKRLLRDRYPA
jgi:acyl-CoA synthetase (AMP-forming)/AMP-acid ligase II